MKALIFASSYQQWSDLGKGLFISFWFSVAFLVGTTIRYFYLRSIRTIDGVIEGEIKEIIKTEMNHMPHKIGGTIHYIDMSCCTLKMNVASRGLISIDLTGELHYKLSNELRIAEGLGNPHPHIKLFVKLLKWNNSIDKIDEYIMTV